MRLALVTDLHANRESVEAVMAHAKEQGAERFAFLGDFVGYGADPGFVVDLVREHVARGAIAVMGNHDAAVVQGPLPTMIPEARQVVAWTRERLDAEQIGFLAALLTTSAFVPQAWMTVRTRDTRSISLAMYVVFNIGIAMWLAYGVLIDSRPMIWANVITLLLSMTILAVKWQNRHRDRMPPGA